MTAFSWAALTPKVMSGEVTVEEVEERVSLRGVRRGGGGGGLGGLSRLGRRGSNGSSSASSFMKEGVRRPSSSSSKRSDNRLGSVCR